MKSSNLRCDVSEPVDPRRLVGDQGERSAERYLQRLGMRILERGYRFRGGEIDLVARDGAELVFVEVKTRTSRDFGDPSEAVTARKRRRIIHAASCYLKAHGAWQHPCRFDVVSVHLETNGQVLVEHLRDAFRAEG